MNKKLIRMSVREELTQLLVAEWPELLLHDVSAYRPDPAQNAAFLTHMFRNECATCEARGARHQCRGCHVARYCSVACQRQDWVARHKAVCRVNRLVKTALRQDLF